MIAALFSLAACQGASRVAAEKFIKVQDRMPVEKNSATEIKWDSRDINLTARCQMQGQEVVISGNIRFASHLVYNYTSLEYFRIYVHFTDDSGKALQKQLLAVNSGYLKPVEDIAFERTFKLSEAVCCLAFEYEGRAVDDGDDSAVGWWFSYNPIDNK